ncbi:MAG TPA: subclass B1 metallo-beta-lactamase [Rhodothermales bacterium]|nr:subclass B1 metallo-beta-lactamase [Rhodothermales bacterium]
MRRRFFLLLAAGLLIVGCRKGQPGDTAADQPGAASTPVDIELQEIRPGVWVHTSSYTYPGGTRFSANGLLVQDGDSLLLVDTAWGELQTLALLDRVASEIGLSVRRAVVTHFHYDRLAGVDVLETQGVDVLAHPLTQRLAISLGTPVPDSTMHTLREPGSARRVGPVEVFYPGPGHAEDNLMVWVPNQRVLFGGCAIRAAEASALGNTMSANVAAWPEAIRRAQARYREVEVVVPGHGSIGGADLLTHTLNLFEKTPTGGD